MCPCNLPSSRIFMITMEAAKGHDFTKTMSKSGKEKMIINNIQGMSIDDINRELDDGGRFVVFQYFMSFIVFTYQGASDIYFFKKGESTRKHSLGYNLITLFLGWWSLEGLVKSPMILRSNFRGGKEVSLDIFDQPESSIPIIRSKKYKTINNIRGMSIDDVNQEVGNGGRFVVFPYYISLVVVSFDERSDVYLIKKGESSLKHGIGYILITLFLGWWSLKGLVTSLVVLGTNFNGGEDITADVLEELNSRH